MCAKVLPYSSMRESKVYKSLKCKIKKKSVVVALFRGDVQFFIKFILQIEYENINLQKITKESPGPRVGREKKT